MSGRPLDTLIGTWAGPGTGVYPTVERFGYAEEITFAAVPTKPFLAYQQRTRHATEDRPLHAESGYWRWVGDGVRIVATVVGGNFGGKNEITTEPVLGLLSKKTGRPVKCTFTRPEEFHSSTTRHPLIMDYKTGVTKDGKLLARKIRLVLDGGAYCSWSETTLGKACILSAGPYQIDNLYAEAFVVYTNKTMTGAMRGFGAPQVCFAYESHMDDIAADLGIDPLEIRLLNALEEGSLSPTSQKLHSVVVKDTLLQAAQRFGWNGSGARS